MQKQDSLDQVEGVDDQGIVVPFAASDHQPVEGREEALGDVPLEPFLELEELAEGRVRREVGEDFALGTLGAPQVARAREADLGEEALDLLETLFDFGPVKGGEVVEG